MPRSNLERSSCKCFKQANWIFSEQMKVIHRTQRICRYGNLGVFEWNVPRTRKPLDPAPVTRIRTCFAFNNHVHSYPVAWIADDSGTGRRIENVLFSLGAQAKERTSRANVSRAHAYERTPITCGGGRITVDRGSLCDLDFRRRRDTREHIPWGTIGSVNNVCNEKNKKKNPSPVTPVLRYLYRVRLRTV